MCIAGGLGIPGSTLQRTRRSNLFVSSKNRLCKLTAWGLLCADWETNLSDLLANAYSPKFENTLDNSEPLCMSMLYTTFINGSTFCYSFVFMLIRPTRLTLV